MRVCMHMHMLVALARLPVLVLSCHLALLTPLQSSQVVEVAGTPEALEAKAEKAAALRFLGRSLAQALEAVERELA